MKGHANIMFIHDICMINWHCQVNSKVVVSKLLQRHKQTSSIIRQMKTRIGFWFVSLVLELCSEIWKYQKSTELVDLEASIPARGLFVELLRTSRFQTCSHLLLLDAQVSPVYGSLCEVDLWNYICYKCLAGLVF
jgi:hypothetical protein